jgi:hypothetical protein
MHSNTNSNCALEVNALDSSLYSIRNILGASAWMNGVDTHLSAFSNKSHTKFMDLILTWKWKEHQKATSTAEPKKS